MEIDARVEKPNNNQTLGCDGRWRLQCQTTWTSGVDRSTCGDERGWKDVKGRGRTRPGGKPGTDQTSACGGWWGGNREQAFLSARGHTTLVLSRPRTPPPLWRQTNVQPPPSFFLLWHWTFRLFQLIRFRLNKSWNYTTVFFVQELTMKRPRSPWQPKNSYRCIQNSFISTFFPPFSYICRVINRHEEQAEQPLPTPILHFFVPFSTPQNNVSENLQQKIKKTNKNKIKLDTSWISCYKLIAHLILQSSLSWDHVANHQSKNIYIYIVFTVVVFTQFRITNQTGARTKTFLQETIFQREVETSWTFFFK